MGLANKDNFLNIMLGSLLSKNSRYFLQKAEERHGFHLPRNGSQEIGQFSPIVRETGNIQIYYIIHLFMYFTFIYHLQFSGTWI